jgi:FemAB-related protein (PEP-CTERM system-associated)
MLSRHPAWLMVLRDGLDHTPYCLEAVEDGETKGLLPLADVRSTLFGRFLVSLPFVNYGGVEADDEPSARRLIDGAVELAERLDVQYLELRHERAPSHPSLIQRSEQKVHMRLDLPGSTDQLWSRLSSKIRNQVRKGQKSGLTVHWGRDDLLKDFYDVFSRNMRDLGTPVYGAKLFRSVLGRFPERSELCVVRLGSVPVAASLVLHGWGISEVPSAGSLRSYNHTCANMLMYWHILERAVQRGQTTLDFGRSSPDSNTFRFKKQWGAVPLRAQWQYHLRRGGTEDMRPDNPRYARLVRLWQRMPVWLTRWIGPRIVRGIP